MFTGIVEELGTVVSSDAQLRVATATVGADARPGSSIAVDGVCLTVVEAGKTLTFDVMPQTLRLTTLGRLRVGDRVNLERAVRADGRFDGHIVQGHVDGEATLISRDTGPDWDELQFAVPPQLSPYVAAQGSIALNGVSLTVTDVSAGAFGVALIPTTLAATNLGTLAVGDRVNVEVDVLAKYVARLLGERAL